tara:strand:- start:11308 stop:12567 length:1260 start_codon:yes stop_codon:yes gene_type:complete
MSFDDVMQPRRTVTEEEKPRQRPQSPPSKKGESLLTNLDIGEWAKNAGLSEELTQQVIVPLVAILDKHGGRIVSPESREVQMASSFASAMTDFLPLMQGAYRYFNGVRKELNEADEALLEAHSAAISATELSNMFGDDVVEQEIEQQESQQTAQNQNTFGPDGFNPPQASNQIIASGKVDYYELLGYGSEDSFNEALGGTAQTTDIYTSQQEKLENQIEAKTFGGLPQKETNIIPIGELTLEQGMTTYDVDAGDTTKRIAQGPTMDSVEITQQKVSQDILEIQSLMAQEKSKHRMNSKIAVEPFDITAEQIIADMKEKAKPSRGGQRVGEDPNKFKSKVSVSDDELIGLAKSAFSIPGLAELQQAEADQAKANSKMSETAKKLPQEEVNKIQINDIKPISFTDAIGGGILSSADLEDSN